MYYYSKGSWLLLTYFFYTHCNVFFFTDSQATFPDPESEFVQPKLMTACGAPPGDEGTPDPPGGGWFWWPASVLFGIEQKLLRTPWSTGPGSCHHERPATF